MARSKQESKAFKSSINSSLLKEGVIEEGEVEVEVEEGEEGEEEMKGRMVAIKW